MIFHPLCWILGRSLNSVNLSPSILGDSLLSSNIFSPVYSNTFLPLLPSFLPSMLPSILPSFLFSLMISLLHSLSCFSLELLFCIYCNSWTHSLIFFPFLFSIPFFLPSFFHFAFYSSMEFFMSTLMFLSSQDHLFCFLDVPFSKTLSSFCGFNVFCL